MKTLRIAALTAAIVVMAPAASRYIGTVTAPGSFWIDQTGVTDHATMFEGSTVQTDKDSAKLQLTGGAQVLLDSGSRAQVYTDHLTLEKGRGQLENGANYRIEAGSMRISLGSPESQAVVAIGDSGVVEVGALEGKVRVRNAEGVEVANLEAGRSVELRLAGSEGTSVLTGCVSKVAKTYVMRDEASGINVELRGSEVNQAVGKRVEVTGAIVPKARAVAPADQVMETSEIKVVGSGCATTIAAAAKGSRERMAPHVGSIASAGGGMPTAVVSGVAVAAGAGGTAAVVAAKIHKPHISHGR